MTPTSLSGAMMMKAPPCLCVGISSHYQGTCAHKWNEKKKQMQYNWDMHDERWIKLKLNPYQNTALLLCCAALISIPSCCCTLRHFFLFTMCCNRPSWKMSTMKYVRIMKLQLDDQQDHDTCYNYSKHFVWMSKVIFYPTVWAYQRKQ